MVSPAAGCVMTVGASCAIAVVAKRAESMKNVHSFFISKVGFRVVYKTIV